MNRHWFEGVALGVLCVALVPCGLLAAEPSVPSSSTSGDAALLLAARIDQLVAASWAAKGVKPAEPADDAEFLRRVYLDVAGRIPRVSEVRAFLSEPAPDKRIRLVERLLESPYYITHFTNVWRALLLPQTSSQQVQFLVPSFEAWLQQQVRDNVRYDRMVRELLTTPVTLDRRQLTGPGGGMPVVFYQANELKAENLAASTSRLFLGVKLECAQQFPVPEKSLENQHNRKRAFVTIWTIRSCGQKVSVLYAGCAAPTASTSQRRCDHRHLT